MRIAILGGGYTGLAAAYYATKNGHDVVLYEKEAYLGGLANGFKAQNWDWSIERAYHHLFTSDTDILSFLKETGYSDVFFSTPVTSSLYRTPGGTLVSEKLDSPISLLTFSQISLYDRIRAGIVLAFLKLSPFLPFFEQISAADFLKKYMGNNAWEKLFGELFRKKFGKYAEKILASFIWTRVKKRSQALGYMKKGFQSSVEHVERVLKKAGAEIHTETTVTSINRIGDQFQLMYKNTKEKHFTEVFDKVICTLPTPVIAAITDGLLPVSYRNKLKKIEYLHAITIIIETEKPILEREYWLSVCVPDMPMMVVVQHTNMVSSKHYGGNHLAYVGNYLEASDPLLKKTDQELFAYVKPFLEEISGAPVKPEHIYVFKAPFAQPIFDKAFLQNKPAYKTPVPGFFIANLDMTYPNDRGTNYAVALGKDVVQFI